MKLNKISVNQNDLKKLSVEQEIDLWKHYDSHLNSVEAGLTNVTAVILAIIALCSLKGNNSDFMFIAIPACMLFFLFYIAYQQRVIEILRGFLCYIEKDIYLKTGNSLMLWSNIGVMKHYNTNFWAQKLCGVLYIFMVLPITIYSFYLMLSDKLETIIVSLPIIITYIIVFFTLGIFFLVDILGNGKIHKIISKELSKIENNSFEEY